MYNINDTWEKEVMKSNPRKGTETFAGTDKSTCFCVMKSNPRKGTETIIPYVLNIIPKTVMKSNPRKGTETKQYNRKKLA